MTEQDDKQRKENIQKSLEDLTKVTSERSPDEEKIQ